ncbi:MAG: MBL fold metallo-hydrolase [Candidatus Omnitrophica bacterium]|nr:MBL fold metallo-hydrolase [Candidatus Omnitrophota bacterium]MCM8790920.1 MBL fold metallo-hydrolase [Candidatus Omnitrophota bacterium]
MIEKLHWLGHASFRLDGAKTVYFDPWKLPSLSKRADLILISHEHFDHFSKDDVAAITAKDTVIVTTSQVAQDLKRARLPCREVVALSAGSSCDAGGIRIKAVPSYNINKDFHPKKSGKLGFLVSVDGGSIYHAGDTDYIPEMENLHCDIALLPVSGTYVMTAEEAARAALAIKPKVAIPMHYGDIVGSLSDAKRFADLLKGKVEVRVMEKEV